MFQDILNQRQNLYFHDKSLQEEFLFTTFNKTISSNTVPSIFDDCLDSPSLITLKDLKEQMNSCESTPQKPSKQKRKRIRKYTSNNPNNKKGHWNQEQNLKYHYFLELHAKYFIDSQRRKIDKVFKSMSAFIETRQPHQCRSHHQKIQKKWGSFPNILLNLRLQNFNKVDPTELSRGLWKLGYHNSPILSSQELIHQQELYKKIVSERVCQKEYNDEDKTQLNNEIQEFEDNISRCHKQNCLCLMMSEVYEDQLEI